MCKRERDRGRKGGCERGSGEREGERERETASGCDSYKMGVIRPASKLFGVSSGWTNTIHVLSVNGQWVGVQDGLSNNL